MISAIVFFRRDADGLFLPISKLQQSFSRGGNLDMETKIAANEQAATSNLFAEETEDIKREATESSLDRDGAVSEAKSFENLGEETTLVSDLGLGEEKKILRESDEGFRAADGSIPEPKQKKRELSFAVASAEEIYKMELQPIEWEVPGIISEGLSILAGPPKMGKSNLALHMAQAVACGGLALSSIKVKKGKVLYLALEDTVGRTQTKLHASESMNGGLVFPMDGNGRLLRDVPKIGEGLEGMLQEWVDANPDTRMIVIDTYQKVKPQKAKSYEDEYRMIGSLKALADKNHIAILLVHHTRKKQGNSMGTDFLETLMGSQAIPGAADTILVMDRRRIQNQILLWVTGRDVEERSLSITFDFERMLFKLDCDTVAATLTGEKKNIVDALSRAGTPMRPKEIAEATGSKPSTVRVTLSRMVDEGLLSVVESGLLKGCYQLAFGDSSIQRHNGPCETVHETDTTDAQGSFNSIFDRISNGDSTSSDVNGFNIF